MSRRKRIGQRASRDWMVKLQRTAHSNVQVRASGSPVGQLPRFDSRRRAAAGASIRTAPRTAHLRCQASFECSNGSPCPQSSRHAIASPSIQALAASAASATLGDIPVGEHVCNPRTLDSLWNDRDVKRSFGQGRTSWQVIAYTLARSAGYWTVGVENRPMSPNSSCSRVRVFPTTTVASGLKTMLRSSLSP